MRDLLFDNLTFEAFPGQSALKYASYTVSPQKRIYLYLLENFLDCLDYTIYDRLIPKACFSWLVFERRNALFDTIQKQYAKRYSTPLFPVTRQALDASLTPVNKAEGPMPVIYYDSELPDPLRDALDRAFGTFWEQHAATKTADKEEAFSQNSSE